MNGRHTLRILSVIVRHGMKGMPRMMYDSINKRVARDSFLSSLSFKAKNARTAIHAMTHAVP